MGTTYTSGNIGIPGMTIADAVAAGSVPKLAGVAWSDNDSLLLNADTGNWERSGGSATNIDSVVVANGAAASGATSGAVKVLPYIPIGQLGAYQSMLTDARGFRSGTSPTIATLVARMANGSTSWAVPVDAVASEAWTAGQTIFRVEVMASANFRRYTNVNSGTASVGTAAQNKAAGTADGFLVIPILWDPDLEHPSGVTSYRPQITEVVKPSAENWNTTGTVVYSNGVSYSTAAGNGVWWRVGTTVPGGTAGQTRGFYAASYQVQTDLALVEHLMRGDYYFLTLASVSASLRNFTIARRESLTFPGILDFDFYVLSYLTYRLILAASMHVSAAGANTSATQIFPGIAFAFDAAILGAGTWSFPADLVVVWKAATFLGSALYVEGDLYAKTLAGSVATGLPAPPFCVDEGSGAYRAPIGGVWGQVGRDVNSGLLNVPSRLGQTLTVDFWSTDPNAISRFPDCRIQRRVVNQALAGANKSEFVDVVSWTAMANVFTDGTGNRTWHAAISLTGSPWHLMANFQFQIRVSGVGGGNVTPGGVANGSYEFRNIGVLPYEYDVPRMLATIKTGGATLTSLAYQGRGYAPPDTLPLVWSGAYSAAVAARVGNAHTITITSTRKSLPDAADAERSTKTTTWTLVVVHPTEDKWLEANTGAKFQTRPVRLLGTAKTGVATDSWSDTSGFATTFTLPRNISAVAVDYTVVIQATTSSTSIAREAAVIEIDTQRVVVTIPPT